MEVTAHSTDKIAPALRAAHWDSVIADTYFPLQLTFRDPSTFSGMLERRQMGQVSLSRLATEPMQYERRPNHITRAYEEEYLVSVPRFSPIDFKQLGREVRCDPGSFILERGDEPYRFSYATPNELLVLKVPKKALVEKIRNPDRFCARIIDARSGLPALFTAMMQQLQVLSDTQGHAASVLGRQIIEVLALALDTSVGEEGNIKTAVRAGHLRRAEQIIRQNLANQNLSPDFVAEGCGISKRYLHELFSDTNKTVSQFIREERLIAARDAIETSQSMAMAEIAYCFGFSDQAQFSRLFKSQFSITPSEWRRNASSH